MRAGQEKAVPAQTPILLMIENRESNLATDRWLDDVDVANSILSLRFKLDTLSTKLDGLRRLGTSSESARRELAEAVGEVERAWRCLFNRLRRRSEGRAGST